MTSKKWRIRMGTFKIHLAISLVVVFNFFLPVLSVNSDNYNVTDDLLYETYPFIKPPPEVLESWEYIFEKEYFEIAFQRIIKYESSCYIWWKWSDAPYEIKNEWVRKFGLTKLAHFSREDNNYKFNWVFMKLAKSNWPLHTLKEIFIKNKNNKMLVDCLDRGLQFNDSDLGFVKEAFQKGRMYFDTTKNPSFTEICFKMIEKKVIIKGMEETAIDFLLHPIISINPKRTAYLKDLLNRPINPDKKSSEAVLQLIRDERYDWAVMLLEKGWPVPNFNNQDLQQIRESGHKGIRQAFPGVRALFQKPI